MPSGKPVKGDVFHLPDSGGPARPGIYSGDRYAVVLQVRASKLTVIIAPTSASRVEVKRHMDGNVFLPAGAGGLSRDSVVAIMNTAVFEIAELGPYVGSLRQSEIDEINKCLKAVFGIP